MILDILEEDSGGGQERIERPCCHTLKTERNTLAGCKLCEAKQSKAKQIIPEEESDTAKLYTEQHR